MKEPNYKNNIEKMSVELWEIAIDVEEREKKLPFYDEQTLRAALMIRFHTSQTSDTAKAKAKPTLKRR